MGITQQIGASSIIKPGVIDNTAARPASPYEGQVIFQKDTDQLLVWNGTAWVIPNSPAQNPTGLELITSANITNSTSTTFGNCFSSTYTNYNIVWSLYKHTAGTTNLTMKFLSASDVDLTYATSHQTLNWAAAFGTSIANASTTGGILFDSFSMTDSQPGMTYNLDVFNANSSSLKLSAIGKGHYGDFGAGTTIGEEIKWYVTGTLQQTFGFKLTAPAGFSGNVAVYGYRK
jgi:hypothetical protein